MTVAIVGGMASLENAYKASVKMPDVKIKVYNQAGNRFANGVGSCDLVVVLTRAVSHQALKKIKKEQRRSKVPVVYVRSPGVSTIRAELEKQVVRVRSLGKMYGGLG